MVCETVVLGCRTALGAAVKIGSAEMKIEMTSSVDEGRMVEAERMEDCRRVDVEGIEDGGRVEIVGMEDEARLVEMRVVRESAVLDGSQGEGVKVVKFQAVLVFKEEVLLRIGVACEELDMIELVQV